MRSRRVPIELVARRHAVAAIALLLIALPLAADPLAELRQLLGRFPANTPFAASGRVQVHSGGEGTTQGGTSSFEVESGPAGFVIRLLPAVLSAAEAEATAKKRAPNSPTPTRTAMVALTLFEVMDAIDAAAMLLNDLAGATLLEQKAAIRNGRLTTELRVKVKPSLATKSRFVNVPKIELRIWIGPGGVPVAAERDSEYSASFLFVKAANVRRESWEYAVHGDRLYATRNDENDRASAAGKAVTSSRTVYYTPR